MEVVHLKSSLLKSAQNFVDSIVGLTHVSIKTALKVILPFAVRALKRFGSALRVSETGVEFKIDLVIERRAARHVLAREQTLMNF